MTLGDDFSTDLDLWITEGLVPFIWVDTEKETKFFTSFGTVWFSLFFTWLVLEFGITGVHDTGGNLPNGGLFVWSETKNIKRFISGFEFDLIVDGLDNDLTERTEFVFVDISGDHAHFVQFGLVTSTQLVEDVETSFSWQLESDT